MADGPDEDATAARARRLGRRIGIGVVLCVALVFIGSSMAQLVPAVFGFDVHPLPAADPGSDARACADGIRALSQPFGTDGPGGAGDLSSRFRPGPGDLPSERTVYRACAASPEGLDAWAAFLRLRRTAEQIPHAGPRQLETLRRDLFAHLPADLR